MFNQTFINISIELSDWQLSLNCIKMLKFCFSRLLEFEDWKLLFSPTTHYFIIYKNTRTPLMQIFHSLDRKWSGGVLVFLPSTVSNCMHLVLTILHGFYWANTLKWLNTTNIRWPYYIHILDGFEQVWMLLFSGPCDEANNLRYALYKSVASLHKEKGF